MPQTVADDAKCMNLWVSPQNRAKLVRAAALRNTDLDNFVTQTALREAEAVIEAAGAVRLTAHAHARVLELLEHPPQPTARLKAAIVALPDIL